MASVKFRISSGLKSIIGRDLITNDFVAIFELVKNAFDAKATHVKVVFDLDRKETAAIYVVDNGKGMSASDVENKWLFVAYSAKKDGEEDLGERRVYAGSKGVGRFSCDRLGRKLFLQSKARTENSVNTIRVDWGAFEKKPKKEFGSVDIDYETAPAFSGRSDLSPASDKNGTVLEDLGFTSIMNTFSSLSTINWILKSPMIPIPSPSFFVYSRMVSLTFFDKLKLG